MFGHLFLVNAGNSVVTSMLPARSPPPHHRRTSVPRLPCVRVHTASHLALRRARACVRSSPCAGTAPVGPPGHADPRELRSSVSAGDQV